MERERQRNTSPSKHGGTLPRHLKPWGKKGISYYRPFTWDILACGSAALSDLGRLRSHLGATFALSGSMKSEEEKGIKKMVRQN
ncbi:hypothetical protein TNCT_655361 [Trichonephila clavata]|uniref:Uncharacterized protein n=1 Tax=Trichonephila clavata TaxID=2740835 RepID=A0A8X6I424_TRICU|nr:hypothetical protein TNCT_655361 [Trichonephila clavata]